MGLKYYLVIIFAIFLGMSIFSISYIFQPAKIYSEYGDGSVIVERPSAISFQGALLTVESWKKYPEYIVALGIIAGLGFLGAIVCIFSLDKILKAEKQCEDA